ncbi:Glycosyltransferase family protein [Candidatus Bealeia paramacronuclearis]|uniref:Glycosyltransferase family protein n=1 Tax=Candidatus Bealeia paramacronuclearis TaxID=1921001 RepID=A0ABZ2C266_9PROT|nr:Glycosyltransferase family protein [Candidatus Bealeia paramacronuclearis]
MLKKILLAVSLFVVCSELSTIEAGKKQSKMESSDSSSDKEDKNSSPNSTTTKQEEKIEIDLQKELEDIFDVDHYKQEHEKEIKESKLSPLEHFMQHGWEKGHQPASWFKTNEFKKHFSLEGKTLEHFFSWITGKHSKKHNSETVVVSVTSHPPRIETTWLSIFSILRQDVKADHIILYLAEEDFPHKKLPKSLVFLQKKGLEIRYSKTNYKVATKLIPALQDFPDATIVTADDDRIYRKDWLKVLLKQHKKHPQDIISPSARKYMFVEGNTYGKTNENSCPHIDYLLQSYFYDNANFGIFEGFSGVLYPKGALHKDVFKFDIFKALTPYADDVFFQAMAILQGTKVRGLPQEIQKDYQWPPEVDGTQISGLFHKHLKANDWMTYRILYYYGLLEKVEITPLKNLKCQACKRKIKLYTSQDTLKPYKNNSSECPTCLNAHKRKILCIGAYPYGNIGDKSYEAVLNYYLGDGFRMYFAPDTLRLNTKGEYIEMDSTSSDLNFDALIIGGGGILHDWASQSDSSISYYIKKGIERQKPYFIVSTGLQTEIKDPNIEETRKILGKSIDLMQKASLIFVRSPKDLQLISSVLGDPVSHKLFLSPDLGYLYPGIVELPKIKKKEYVTLIQTGSASVENEHVRLLINQKLKEHSNSQLVVMNWGGPEDPLEKKDFKEFDLFSETTKKFYPNALVFMGNSIDPKLKEKRYKNATIRKSDVTPEQAIEILEKSHFVITGRYHGMIFAKALGIPYNAPISTHKILAEKESSLDITKTNIQLNKIKNFIILNSSSIDDPSLWVKEKNDDLRNTYIVKTHETYGIPISHLQGMSNKLIWKILAFGNLEE